MSKSRSNQEERVASFDGELHTNLISGDKVIITRAPKKAKIVKTSKLSFFQVLAVGKENECDIDAYIK